MQSDSLTSRKGATGDESVGVHPQFTSLSLPHYHRRDHHQQQQQSAGNVHDDELFNSTSERLTSTTNTPKLAEGTPTATAQPCEAQPSPGSDVERGVSADVPPGSEQTQIVVEVHPAAQNDAKVRLFGDQDSGTGGVRSSAPELRTVSTLDDHAARASSDPQERPQRRQFVVVAVSDDVVNRLTTQVGVHTSETASGGVRRSGSCTLPSGLRSPTTSTSRSRRFVISLMNLDTGSFSGSGSAVRPTQCRPSVLSPLQSSSVVSGCTSNQTASVTLALEASSSSMRCMAASDGNWREVSNELWSLRALLANHDDTSVDESVDETTTTTTVTTPQSADDVSVKSSADTVVSVDDRPPQTSSTAATPTPPLASTTTTVTTGTTTITSTVTTTPLSSAVDTPARGGADDGITRKPSIRRQNYREAIARRQNHQRLQADSNELSIPTSSVEATDTESSFSLDWCTLVSGSLASSNETTASSFNDSMTSTDSTAGGSGSDGHGGGHRLEQLRGDSGYRSLEAQQSLGQAREFRRQSASHSLLDSSANVIYEDQITTTTMTTTSCDDVRTPAAPTGVVSVQQIQQHSAAVSPSIPVPLSTTAVAETAAASGSADNVRSEHTRHNKAAQRKRIQYRCDRQDIEIHDSVAVGDPVVDYKVTQHRHHHHYHRNHQPHRRGTDADTAPENLSERVALGTTTTTTTTTTTKPSLFSRLLRTTHVASGSSAGGSGVSSSRNSFIRIQRDYSIDERSNAIFNEFLRHDPTYDIKHTLSVHARSSRPAGRRSRVSRSPVSARAARRRAAAADEQASSTLTSVETLPSDGNGQPPRHYASHTAPNTATTSPLLNHKNLLVDMFFDPRASTSLTGGYSSERGGRRRSEGCSRLTSDVTAATIHATDSDRRRASTSTSTEQSPSDDRQLAGTGQTALGSRSNLPPTQDDASADVEQPVAMSITSQRRSGTTTSRRIPVIQLTTDDDTL